MPAMLALLRTAWLTSWSYRTARIFGIASLLASVVPLYFIANAVQPIVADHIAGQGGDYFAFAVVGIAVLAMLGVPINGVANVIGSGIRTGTLEAMLSTRASLPTILSGALMHDLLWSAIRMALMFTAAALLGARFSVHGLLPAMTILVLILLSYLAFGLLTAALVVAFRTPSPLPKVVLVGSALLGGVYYPTEVIPSWIHSLSLIVPLTYGLRAMRQVLLDGQPFTAVLADASVLLLFSAVTLGLGILIFRQAFSYARRAGTLAQY
jgi:ABC-2 type transport system permease protein